MNTKANSVSCPAVYIYATTMRLISPQAHIILLKVHIPETGGGNPNNAAAEPPACVPVQQAPGVSAAPQVIYLFVDHHRPTDRRQPSKQRCLGFNQRVDFPMLGLKVTKVPGVVGVVDTMWIVVTASGVTAPAQVSILMYVHRPGLRAAFSGEAVEPEKDFELSLRVILLEQRLAVHFGQTLR